VKTRRPREKVARTPPPAPRSGAQIRRAITVLLRAFDAADRARGGALLGSVDAAMLYDAALTVVMRLIYLVRNQGSLFDVAPPGTAGILPAYRCRQDAGGPRGYASLQSNPSEKTLGVAAHGSRTDHHAAMDLVLLHRRLRAEAEAAAGSGAGGARDDDAWPEVLAVFRSIQASVRPTGALFDPGRYPFLGTPSLDDVTHPALLHMHNATVLDVLDAVRNAVTKLTASAADTDTVPTVDVMGALYEEARDGRAARADEPLLGLAACAGRAPYVSLPRLEDARAEGYDALLSYLRRQTGRTPGRLAAGLASMIIADGAPLTVNAALHGACDGDSALYRRVLPFSKLLRDEADGRPCVVPLGRIYVTDSAGRRGSGMYYTPPAVAATVVRHALEQVVYEKPDAGYTRGERRLCASTTLLDLKVCDMAMGCGVFLVESCRYLSDRLVEAWETEGSASYLSDGALNTPDTLDIPCDREERRFLARRLVAARCLYGVDKDPIAVDVAKLALRALVDGRWSMVVSNDAPLSRVAGEDANKLSSLDHKLRVGDALIGEPNCRLTTDDYQLSFDWPLAFPEVFCGERERAGFDAIVGNPPFGNRIERATALDSSFKRYAAAQYAPFAHGAGDYCLLFWARALLHLLAPAGAYGWLSPTALLSDLKPWQAWVHAHARPTALILYPADLFPSARIRTTGYCGRRGQAPDVTVVDYDTAGEPSPVTRPWPASPARWYEVTQQPAAPGAPPRYPGQEREWDMAPLDTLPIRLHAGCATGAAYQLAPLVTDDANGPGARLVTTGALDRYDCTWGRAPTRYLHKTCDCPRWPVDDQGCDIPPAVTYALERQRGPKILIGGLTAVLECWLDTRGDAAGVVSTWVIAPGEGVTLDGLSMLLAVLNSATFSRIYMGRYGARSMSGRHTTIYKQALREMPCPVALGPAMLSTSQSFLSLPSHDAPDLTTQAGLLAACRDVGRAIQELPVGHPRRDALDRLGHRAAALLYGRGEDGAADDYAWWRRRANPTLS